MNFRQKVHDDKLFKMRLIERAAALDAKKAPQSPVVAEAIAGVTIAVVEQVQEAGVPVGDKSKDA
jgi:hypothetical protein